MNKTVTIRMKKEHLGLCVKSLEEVFAGFIDTFNAIAIMVKKNSDNLAITVASIRLSPSSYLYKLLVFVLHYSFK
jgi:hypothetical protein